MVPAPPHRVRTLALFTIALLGACSGSEPGTSEPEIEGLLGSVDQVDRWYASPTGSAGGNGTLEHPWSLDTALAGGRKINGVRPVGPGDTVWLRGGTYTGRFNTTIGGLPGHRVVFSSYPGEWAILDGNNGAGSSSSVLALQMSWTEFLDLEITHGNPARTAKLPNLVSNYGSNNRFVGLTLHDGGVGLYNEHDASGTEIAGCVIYHNGWLESNEGHGHGLYLKSDAGPVTARGNVIFDQFGFGIHAYSSQLSTGIDSVVLEGNVTFNNSAVHRAKLSANILLGGEPGVGAVRRSVVEGNLAYFAPGVNAANVKIGYDTTRNAGARVHRNVIAGGLVVLDVKLWSSLELTDDTVIGNPGDTSRVVALTEPNSGPFQWGNNRYYNVAESSPRWRHLGTSYPLATWHSRTGFTSDSVVAGAPPARTAKWTNPDGRRRAVISVLHDGSGSARVDLGAALAPGDSFVVRNVQRLGTVVASGTYGGGAIDIPLAAVPAVNPRNWSMASPGTGSVLHVFVVERMR